MNRKLKYGLACICIIVLCCFALAGCGKKDITDITPESVSGLDEQTTGEEETEADSQETVTQDAGAAEQETPSLDQVMGPTKEVSVYSFESDTFNVIDVVKVVPEEDKLTAEYVVNLVLEEFSANSLEVGVLDVTAEGDSVTVNFDGTKPPAVNVGAGLEITILDCISHSLLDNVEGCSKVYFRIDGGRFETGHTLFELDEPYE